MNITIYIAGPYTGNVGENVQRAVSPAPQPDIHLRAPVVIDTAKYGEPG